MKKKLPSFFHIFFARSIGIELPEPKAHEPSLPSLPPALRAERFSFEGINCYVAGNGPPLLLVHSVNAAASAAEMRPIFEHYMATRTVFAIDLPGYGFSDRSDRAYTPRLMTHALHAVSRQIRQRFVDVPIDAAALSLGCEFLARAAVEDPSRWGRLALISPTGLDGRTSSRAPREGTRFSEAMHEFLSLPLWAKTLFGALTRPVVVRYFLQRSWGSKAIDETAWAYAVKTARQQGARFAPFYFLSGGLFSTDILNVYANLTQPVWLSHGTRGDFTDYQGASRFATSGNWHTTVFETGALPHFEKPTEFFASFDKFLKNYARSPLL